MSEFTRTVDGVTYLDETRLWAAVSTRATPVQARLREFLRLAGVKFFDEPECNFVLQPLVAVTGFGGFPISFDATTPEGHLVLNRATMTPTEIVAGFNNTMGRAGFYSYMNPGNHTPEAMNAVTTKHGHFSKAHTVTVDLALLGYSAAIEGNLMILRRWFNHVGRLTNTRTLAQCDPPLVVMEPEDLSVARAVRSAVAGILSAQAPPKRGEMPGAQYQELLSDYYERVNGLWPNSRALILMVNAEMSNLRSTMPDIADKGQEREQRRLLAMLNDTLRPLFPEMLKHSSEYGYEMPQHWPARQAWEKKKGSPK